MFDIIEIAGTPITSLAVSSALGAVAGYLSSYACDVAETIKDERALVPEVVKALCRGRFGGRRCVQTAAVCAAVCAAVPLAGSIGFAALSILVIAAVAASVVDIRLLVIPEEFTWLLLFAGALASPWNAGAHDAVIGASIAAGATYLIMTLTEYRTGIPLRSGGDIAAAAAGGAWVGMYSSGAYLFTVCVLAACYASIVNLKGPTIDECSNESGDARVFAMCPALLAAIPISAFVAPLIQSFAFGAL